MNDTVRSKMLEHLKKNIRFMDDYNAPESLTQTGMAIALGISRSHVAVEVRKLTNRGMACAYLRHVDGHKTRMKVYGPTYQSGSDKIMRLKPSDYDIVKNHLRAALEMLVAKEEQR